MLLHLALLPRLGRPRNFDLLYNFLLSLLKRHEEHVHVFQRCLLLKVSLQNGAHEISKKTLIDGVELVVLIVILIERARVIVSACSGGGGCPAQVTHRLNIVRGISHRVHRGLHIGLGLVQKVSAVLRVV